MKILHTADWHIGQLFHGYDRTLEHQNFLNWLVEILHEQQIDVLLVSGDVFDFANPSAASTKMFYHFLQNALHHNPNLQMVITAGNHDSAHRLEAPAPLLVNRNVHIVGFVERTETGEIDYEKLLIPLYGSSGDIEVWCMAVPYLRLGEYPSVKDCDNPYTEGVELLYQELFALAETKKEAGQCIIAMGHLHALHCEMSDADTAERGILGGLEGISCRAFHSDIRYVALGHIHKAQCIAGHEHIRYCGSPLPMSFTEHQYKHQVLSFEIGRETEMKIRPLEVPVTISLKKIPEKHKPIFEVISELSGLEDHAGQAWEYAPYLLVKVLLDGPEPALRKKIEEALQGKYVRLCRIDAVYTRETTATAAKPGSQLQELRPLQVLHTLFEKKYNNKLPDNLEKLFREVEAEVDSEN